jgi:hypothetical protein
LAAPYFSATVARGFALQNAKFAILKTANLWPSLEQHSRGFGMEAASGEWSYIVPVSVCSHAEAQTHVIMTVSAQGAAIDLLLELAHAGALKSKVSKSGPTLTDIKKIDSTESRGRVGVMT